MLGDEGGLPASRALYHSCISARVGGESLRTLRWSLQNLQQVLAG